MPETRPRALPRPARAALLAWYDERGRTIAFRATRDPYAILVSEVMAQQTQIARVEPAWRAFLERFPSVRDLAAAAPADVLRAWRGMGYDRRALNLRRAAVAIVTDHDGEVPADLATLERLPGIGPYTARAVAAIAFGRPVGAVDTNVRRVIGRALALDPADARQMQAAADASVPRARPADWTHALMDLGATVCRSRVPRCDACPIATWCRSAYALPPSPRIVRRRTSPVRFTSTTRWLRGRILDRLRGTAGAGWTRIEAPIGDHDADAVDSAVRALAHDGLIELDPAEGRLARLATA
ncbi:MAG TPA: A/G-specific adenine glycosylase [Candidatus Limnocylindrales bacterium]|nr:A/G-specific adenine glycosylase [Candidatus Limnocylindrales bacterium]